MFVTRLFPNLKVDVTMNEITWDVESLRTRCQLGLSIHDIDATVHRPVSLQGFLALLLSTRMEDRGKSAFKLNTTVSVKMVENGYLEGGASYNLRSGGTSKALFPLPPLCFAMSHPELERSWSNSASGYIVHDSESQQQYLKSIVGLLKAAGHYTQPQEGHTRLASADDPELPRVCLSFLPNHLPALIEEARDSRMLPVPLIRNHSAAKGHRRLAGTTPMSNPNTPAQGADQ